MEWTGEIVAERPESSQRHTSRFLTLDANTTSALWANNVLLGSQSNASLGQSRDTRNIELSGEHARGTPSRSRASAGISRGPSDRNLV